MESGIHALIMKLVLSLLEKYKSFSAPVKASFWALFCSVFQSGFSLVTTPVFTRFLTQEEYGIYSQYSSWLAILSILITLNLSGETFIKGLTDHVQDEEQFTAAMLGLNTLIFAGFLVLFLLAPSFWAKLLNLTPLLTGLMFVHLFVSNPFDYWKSGERYHFRYKLSTILSILITVLGYALSIYAVMHFSDRLNARVEADILVRCIVGLPLCALIFIKGKSFFQKDIWVYALTFSLPLVPHYLSSIVLNQSDRLMIGQMIGNAEAGKYSIAYMIASMVLMIFTAVNSSFVPYTFQKLKNNEVKTIRSSSNTLFLGFALLCLAAMVLAPEIITIFAGESYAEAAGIVPAVSASVFFICVYNFFSNVEYYYQKTQWIGMATLLGAGLNVLLNWILIPKFGYMVAGTTTLVSFIFLAFTHYISYRSIIKQEHSEDVYDIGFILKLSIALVGITCVMNQIYHLMFIRYVIVLVSAAAAVRFFLNYRNS